MVDFLIRIKMGVNEKDRSKNWHGNHDKKGGQTNDQSQCVLSE